VRAVYHPEFKASFEAALKHYEDIGRPLADFSAALTSHEIRYNYIAQGALDV